MLHTDKPLYIKDKTYQITDDTLLKVANFIQIIFKNTRLAFLKKVTFHIYHMLFNQMTTDSSPSAEFSVEARVLSSPVRCLE